MSIISSDLVFDIRSQVVVDICVSTNKMVSYRKHYHSQHSQLTMKKTFVTCSLFTMHNLFVVSHTACPYVGGPKIFGDAGAPAPWD